jgi:phosphoribosylglycinamide formyltransferase 2
MTSAALRVMLLGAGELGKEVIIALQRLGVEVIAVDRYDNAPGHQVAHQRFTIDMVNPDALHALIHQTKPHLIVPEIEAIATDELIKIEAAGLARVVPTARATRLTMNREGIRRLAAEELQLPTSRYLFAESHDELKHAAKQIGFPCVVKPVMSSSGKGQSQIASEADLAAAWDNAMQGGRVNRGRVIVEEMINFEYEITLLTIRYRATDGTTRVAFCDPIGHKQVQGDYVESWQPQRMTDTALRKAQEIAARITDNLGGWGLFGVELFVNGDNVWFSEVSPRPHDTGMVTMATQLQNEFELHARAILGLPINTTRHACGASAVIYGGLNAEAVCFANLAEALEDPDTDLRLFGKPRSSPKRRMGVALARAADCQTARAKALHVAATVTIEAKT